MDAASPWQRLCAEKKAATHAKIPNDWVLEPSIVSEARNTRKLSGAFIESLLDDHVKRITAKSSVQLVEQIASGSLTAFEVTEAFCKRAAVAHQIGNCLHEIFFDHALDRARNLDKYYATTKKTSGPLHGLPVSLKDQFHIKGIETTMGYAGWIKSGSQSAERNDRESELVRELLSLGAVLYCKTSLPQTLCIGEVHNNIIGYTWNPVNQRLSCGGSSGGEGALQALGGSSIGFGTDQGGSVRIPAAFCGLYSIKPSYGRISYRNVSNNAPGQTVLPSVVGVLSSSLLSLKLMMAALSSIKPWNYDSTLINLPWRSAEMVQDSQAPDEHLCLGIMFSDGVVSPHPPVRRGMQIMVDALSRNGHQVIDWKPPPHAESNTIHQRLVFSDNGDDIRTQCALSGEPIIPELARFIATDNPPPPIPLLQYEDLALKKQHFQDRYTDYWHSTIEQTGTGRPVDGVILPVAPTAAVINDKFMHYGYVNVANLLDYTCVSIPVTTADQELDPFDKDYRPLNDLDRKNWEAYDAEIYHGAPVGVQIMGQRLEEEKMLSITEIICRALDATRG